MLRGNSGYLREKQNGEFKVRTTSAKPPPTSGPEVGNVFSGTILNCSEYAPCMLRVCSEKYVAKN